MKRFFMGDSCVVWSLGNTIDVMTSQRVLTAYHQSKEILKGRAGVFDIVPSYTEIALHFDPLIENAHEIISIMESVIREPKSKIPIIGDSHLVSVEYSGEDLERVCRHTTLSVKEVIHRHTVAVYTVAMIGFQPYFPYLIGLDQSLETPRLKRPRTRVQAGSVAIGGAQTGIYPSPSPGGWNIIGHTTTDMLPSLKPGDQVRFKEVTFL